jgi:phosphoglycerate dehydrogenase-like enzyme
VVFTLTASGARLRTMNNATVTPHLGYVTAETLADFYVDTLETVTAYAESSPTRA